MCNVICDIIEVTWPQCCYFWCKTHGISHKTLLLLEFWWYTPIQAHDILPLLVSTCPHYNDFWSSNTHLLGSPSNCTYCGAQTPYIGIKNFIYRFINTWKTLPVVNYNLFFYCSFFSIILTKCLYTFTIYSHSLTGNTLTSQGMYSCIQVSFSIHITILQ